MNADAKLVLLNGVIARELLVREGLRRGLDREPSIAREVERTEQRAVMNKLYEEEALHGDYTSTEEGVAGFCQRARIRCRGLESADRLCHRGRGAGSTNGPCKRGLRLNRWYPSIRRPPSSGALARLASWGGSRWATCCPS